VKFDDAAKDPEYKSWRERQEHAAQEMGDFEQRLFEEWTEAKKAGYGSTAVGDDDEYSNSVSIESPVDANVWKVLVKPGDTLEAGQAVVVLEATKMEINVVAAEAQSGAVVTKISHPPGSVVSPGTTVIKAHRGSINHYSLSKIKPLSAKCLT